MTDTNFTENDLSFDVLFKNGTCMTYDPTPTMDAFRYAQNMKKEYCQQNNVKRALIKSKAELYCWRPKFHYFSNGILIHNFTKDEDKTLQRVLTVFAIRNLPIRKIYALSQVIDRWKGENYMRHLSERANLLYPYKEDIKIVPFPKLEEFVRDCFANGNVLLTASKNENVNPNIRDCAALFADGRYYVADGYGGSMSRHNNTVIEIFRKEHEDCVFLEKIHVPSEYIAALYKEAEKYDWYASADEIRQKNRRSDAEISKMQHYIENLFNGRKCLSVTNIESHQPDHFGTKPDIDKYALFTDGTLVVGDSRPNAVDTYWYDKMCAIYKDLKLKIESVPDYYIPAIYAALPKYQRSASEIYMEMLKEKAKKLKQELSIPHYKALDIVAQISDWDNFQAVKIEDEAHARHLISAEKWRQEIYKGSVLKEYEAYLRDKK